MAFVLWHDGVGEGFDRCALSSRADGHRLIGSARVPDLDATLDYDLHVDTHWSVTELHLVVHPRSDGVSPVTVRLARDGERWQVDGEDRPDLVGLRDLDLGYTCVGLTPLIHRSALVVSEAADVEVITVSVAPDGSGSHAVALGTRTDRIAHVGRDVWEHTVGGRAAAVHLGPRWLVAEYEDRWKAVATG